jgi:MFS superfamily sulfate permease-like transporter
MEDETHQGKIQNHRHKKDERMTISQPHDEAWDITSTKTMEQFNARHPRSTKAWKTHELDDQTTLAATRSQAITETTTSHHAPTGKTN